MSELTSMAMKSNETYISVMMINATVMALTCFKDDKRTLERMIASKFFGALIRMSLRKTYLLTYLAC